MDIAFIPQPVSINKQSGTFVLPSAFNIATSHTSLHFTASYLKKRLRALTGKRSGRSLQDPALQLKIAPSAFPEAARQIAYTLHITSATITIQGVDTASVWSGAITLIQMFMSKMKTPLPCMEISDTAALSWRGYHLDVRVQMLTMSYLKKMIDRLALLKYNMLVIEWEDKFLYKKHPLISHQGCYTPDDIETIRQYAQERFIEVVPQLQCLGHFTYVLKHDLYAHLRETPQDLSQMCPSNPQSMQLFKDLAQELMLAFPDTKYFHIGGDETLSLGDCPKCAAIEKEKGRGYLYARYIGEVCALVKKMGLIPIVWGDILLKYPEQLKMLPKDIIINDWDYYSTSDSAGEIASLDIGTKKTTGLGHADTLAKAGFPVLASPSVRSAPDGVYNVDVTMHLNNVGAYCRKAVNTHMHGVLITSWAHTGQFDVVLGEWGTSSRVVATRAKTPRLPIEITWSLLAAGAEFSWNTSLASMGTLATRFGKLWHGLDKKDSLDLFLAQKLSGARIETALGARKNLLKLHQAINQVRDLQPTRNISTLKHFLFILQLARHHAEKVMVTDYIQKKLQDGNMHPKDQKILAEIVKEAKKLRKVNALLLRELYPLFEIKEDNYVKFDMEFGVLQRYLDIK